MPPPTPPPSQRRLDATQSEGQARLRRTQQQLAAAQEPGTRSALMRLERTILCQVGSCRGLELGFIIRVWAWVWGWLT